MTTTMIVTGGKFAAGEIVITQGARRQLTQDEAIKGLLRHLSGDWGVLDEHDWKENDAALEYGFRISSRYVTPDGTKFWIVTEHDRTVTTILLPNEY